MLFLCLLAAPSWLTAQGERSKAPEYWVKAGYLYNFLLFAEWPDEKKHPPPNSTCICILGRDPFGDYFDNVEGKYIEARKSRLTVKRLGLYREGLDLEQCRILFIDASDKEHFREITERLRGRPVLTVSDADGFIRAGGMINFIFVGRHVRWTINYPAVEAAGLRLSSQLLRNAARVIRKGEEVGENNKNGAGEGE